MRVVLSYPLVILLLATGIHGKPWRATPSSPLLKPFVVAKDISTSRAATSLSSSIASSGVTSSSSQKSSEHTSAAGAQIQKNDSSTDADLHSDTDKNIAQESTEGLSDDVARGGHSTMTKPQDDPVVEEEDTSLVVDDASEKNETVVLTINAEESQKESHSVVKKSMLQRRRERKKKKKLDTSAAVYAKKLKNRNTLNIRRKIMHCNFGLFFAALNHFIPKNKFVPGMTVLTSATLVMELLRYRKGFGWMNDVLHFILGSSLRKHEMEGKFTGSFYFFFGVTVTAALYPTTCATMGICQLALADPSASYFGRQTRHVYWSRIEGGLGGFGRNKGVLGFLGGALFCFPFNYRVLSIAKFGPEGIPGGSQALMFASLALGFAGAFADLAVPTPALTMPKRVCGVRVPPFHVDDNFVVPIVSGFACTKVFQALGWSQDLQLSKFVLL